MLNNITKELLSQRLKYFEIYIVKTPTQPQHNLKATKPNSTKVGFETKITLHHHIISGSSQDNLWLLHRNSKYSF